MKTHPIDLFFDDEVAILERIRQIIKLMPEPVLGVDENGHEIKISCHLLADTVSRIYGLTVVRGYFAGKNVHSWVKTKYGNVIELYPWGASADPFMLSRVFVKSSENFYNESDGVFVEEPKAKSYQRAVEILIESFKDVDNRIGRFKK